MAADASIAAIECPVRAQAILSAEFSFGDAVCFILGIDVTSYFGFALCVGQCPVADHLSDVLANDVTVISVDSAIGLLQIDKIGRQIPMHDRMAMPMKVKASLPD